MMVTISIAPASPAARRRFRLAKLGSKRRLKPIINGVPAFATTARQARIRSDERSTGFSQKTALPARAPASIRSECMSVGVPTRMASIPASAMISSMLATRAPVSSASACAAWGRASATATSSALGWAATLAP